MTTALDKLFANGSPPASDIDLFTDNSIFPLVHGNEITFVYRGSADEVLLRSWISGLNTAQSFQKLAGSDLWALTIELPEGSRIEYKLEVVANGQRSLILDPLNKVTAQDPFGANSVCQGEGYQRPSWSLPNDEARPGACHGGKIYSTSFAEEREYQVYLPARYKPKRRYPLLIVHDGFDYFNFAALGTVLDNLIHQLEIPAMIVVMTQSPDRLNEYAGDDRHAAFITQDLLPHLQKEYPLIDEVQARGLMGARDRKSVV